MFSTQTLIFHISALTGSFFLWPVCVKRPTLSFWYAILLTITRGIHSELVNIKVHTLTICLTRSLIYTTHTCAARLLNTRQQETKTKKSLESLFKASEVIFLLVCSFFTINKCRVTSCLAFSTKSIV